VRLEGVEKGTNARSNVTNDYAPKAQPTKTHGSENQKKEKRERVG